MSSTFTSPSGDTFPHWIRSNAQQSPDYPFFVYGDGTTECKVITRFKAAQAFGRATRMMNSLKDPKPKGDAPQIFGMLANLDTLTYLTVAAGIMMSGCPVFLISPRNSPAAIAHLLQKTNTHMLFVSDDSQMQNLSSLSLSSASKNGHHVDVLPLPTFQDLYPDATQDGPLEELPDFRPDSPALIIHSSGSTAFPKPIALSHRKLAEIGKTHFLFGPDVTRVSLSIHQLPPFHAMATNSLMWAIYSGVTLAFFPPKNPPMIPTPQSVLDAAVKCKSSILFTVPLFVEMWSRSDEDIEKLKSFDTALYAGGPLNKQIGDELTRKGVHLTTIFGMSEIGIGSRVIITGKTNPEWEWFHRRLDIQMEFLPQEGDTDTFEIVYIEGPNLTPAVLNTEINGKRAYATSDLVQIHPEDPTKFRIYGRKDDQIMLSTGEKTNPGPMETIICRHPYVHAAVIFGRGRVQNGIIIQPVKGHEFDPANEAALAKFRNAVWASVEEANAYAPTHSRLYKEMIIVTHPSKPFEMTVKLLPRRHVVVEHYKAEIDAVYAAAEASGDSGIPPPSEWIPEHVQGFVRETVQAIMGTKVGDDDDIFLRGADSLNATYIRNSLVQALRQADKNPTTGISQNFVYANPSISGLTHQLLNITVSDARNEGDAILSKLEEMDQMVAEFTANFPLHRSSTTLSHPAGEVVLLTGTTGALGVQILAHLVSLPEISHVYALNRAGPKTLRERQLSALVERGLDIEIINSPKVTLVEGDTSIEGFAIPTALFNKIRDSISLIILNAWRVNFNVTLESFKPNVLGVRNLVNLALNSPKLSPPRLIFTGTVSVFRNRRENGRPLEASIHEPRWVIGSGYSESKFVAERILERAAELTPLRPIIVRIGQMTSNSSGAWNSSDWLPALVRSGQVIGALPSRDDSVSWIGMDVAARALVDFRTTTSQYLHLAHPKPTTWNTLFTVFSLSLHVPLVGWAEWLSRLEKDTMGPESNPAVHLLEFFRGASSGNAASEEMEAPGTPFLDLKQALKSSSSLASPSLPALSSKDAEGWIRYWKMKGLLSK